MSGLPRAGGVAGGARGLVNQFERRWPPAAGGWRLACGKAWAGEQRTARRSQRMSSRSSTLLLSFDQKLFTRKGMGLFLFKSCPFPDRHLMQVLTNSIIAKRWLAVGSRDRDDPGSEEAKRCGAAGSGRPMEDQRCCS